MLETILELEKHFNGSGSELPLSEFLYSFFAKRDIPCRIDRMGSVVATIKGSESKKKVMITCPLDCPSFLTLYTEKNKAFLTKIAETKFTPKEKDFVVSENGKIFSLKKSPYDEKEFYISGKDLKIGDAFRLKSEFSKSEEDFNGRYVSRYALIALLMQLSKEKPKDDLIIAFAAGFENKAKSEANISFAEKPDVILFLGTCESENKAPSIAIKNGKRFSDKELTDEIAKANPNLICTVHPNAITKADTVFFPSTAKIASISLPAKHIGEEKESTALFSIKEIENTLKKLFF